ncbi:SCO5389 family protein [Qaidamihabitans albus]|uniref:SCO5389 family protein n=1 Tax=Qaidamihabitans albus TaxID=2795733 RepID=UPI0018F1B7F5|nr:SCO5389 family protein [Qaidamihabitans albus]
MSLNVPAALQAQAEAGDINDADFLRCIQESLPYAWSVVSNVAKDLQSNGEPFAVNEEVPPTEEAWGQLFRLVASDSMRSAVEKHFGARLAFQNCCKVGLFQPTATKEYAEFTSARAQVLNQKPELLNC